MPINFVTSSLLIWRGRKVIAWRVLLREVAIPISIGFLIGIAARSRMPTDKIVVVFALFVTALAASQLRQIAAGIAPRAPRYASIWLLGGGVIQGLFGTGGPLVIHTLAHRIVEKAVFRSTLAVVWLTLNVGLCASLATEHAFTRASLGASLGLAVPMLIGMRIGEFVFRRLKPEAFRKFIYQLLLLASVLLLVRALR